MSEKLEFLPSDLKMLGVSSHQAMGRAVEIMLRAVGFGAVEIAMPMEACTRAAAMNPDFILFTPEYLLSPIQEKIEIGCPCSPKKFCGNAQVVMLLKKPNADSVFSSKEMGFDSIVFADASVNKMYVTLERAYLHHHRI